MLEGAFFRRPKAYSDCTSFSLRMSGTFVFIRHCDFKPIWIEHDCVFSHNLIKKDRANYCCSVVFWEDLIPSRQKCLWSLIFTLALIFIYFDLRSILKLKLNFTLRCLVPSFQISANFLGNSWWHKCCWHTIWHETIIKLIRSTCHICSVFLFCFAWIGLELAASKIT